MGKSSKKSNVGEVPPAGVTVPPVKSAKKGKRGSEQPTAKSANTKKQKVEVVGQGRKKSKKPQVLEKKKPETNSSEDITSSDSEEEIVKKVSIHAKKLPPTPSKNGTTAAVSKEGQPQSNSESDSDSKDVALKNASQDMSSDDDEDKSSDELPQAQRDELKRESDESNSSEEDSSEGSDDESENEQTMNSPKKKATSDATGIKSAARSEKKELQTPAVSQNQKSGSKTLFVGNLSYDVGEDDVKEFFKEAGEIVDVRFSQDADGRFRGFGHVEFVDVEGAQKAIELNGQELSGRAVKLDFAREKGAYTPNNGKDDNSHQKSGKGQSQTIFVRGFDKSVEMDEIEGSLKEYFGSCGEITRVSLPRDYETGGSKGIAYLDFKEEDGFSKALELNGSELGESTLTVEEAKPKGAGSGGGGGGGGGGGRGGRGGRRGGFGGGRGGGRSGFGGGRGGRGSGRGGGRGRKW